MKRRDAIALAGGAVISSVAMPAHAWIPGADFLLTKLFDRRKNMKAVTVTGALFIYDKELPNGRRQVAQTVHMKLPTAVRLEVTAPNGDYIELADGKRKVSIRNGKAEKPIADSVDVWRALMIGDALVIKANARAAGVDFEKVSLGRLHDDTGERRRGDVCYIVGAAVQETEKAQLWIAKDSLTPRWFKEKGEIGKARSIAFEGWTEQAMRGWFPALTTRRRGKNLVEEFRAEEVKTNPKHAKDLFDIAALIAAANKPPAPKKTKTPTPKTPKKPKK